MYVIISNPYTNPDYSKYMNDEEYLNDFCSENNAKLISAYWNSQSNEREFIVEL